MGEYKVEVVPDKPATKLKETKLDGVVIGILMGFDNDGMPLVAFPGNPNTIGVNARTTVVLSPDDLGREVALLFEGGDPRYPLVIGRIQHPEEIMSDQEKKKSIADLDGERVVLSAKKEIVLKCGKASITLTHAGKILIRGAYLLSRSSGVNRIKGGSVQIN
ncbi:MAG: hypothetical protein GY807_11755 [Gammaproteobacteria bacterium]|nr:hypothetical protein [Gammaproteobacteria bacterium]